MLEKLKKSLDKAIFDRSVVSNNIENLESKMDDLHYELVAINEARELLQRASALTQNSLANYLSDTVTKALELVFDGDSLGFSVEFVVKRNTTECEMFLTEDGEKYNPLKSCGFGAADVISFALRIAMWNMNKSAPIMVFDEPFRNLDYYRVPNAALLASTLSKELGIQMIIVSHEDELKYGADKAYKVVKVNGVSSAKELVTLSE